MGKSERREKERRAVSRTLCPRCSRPSTVCVCQGLPSDGKKIELDVHVLVLQHPNENRKKNVSTVPLMPLVLRHFSFLLSFRMYCGMEDRGPCSCFLDRMHYPSMTFTKNDTRVVLVDGSIIRKLYRSDAPA